LIERSFQGLSVAIETMRIDEELMEIWPNEVCDRRTIRRMEAVVVECYKCSEKEHKYREYPL